MRFEVRHEYAASVEEVVAVLTDFASMREKYESLGQSGVELVERDEAEDGSVTVTTRRVVPLELPGFASKFLSPRQTVIQTDTWSAADVHGVRTGTFAVQAKGAPVKVSGTMRLEPDGPRGCVDEMSINVECKVPLVGGKLADFVGGDTRKAVDHEQTWVAAHLAGRRTGGARGSSKPGSTAARPPRRR